MKNIFVKKILTLLMVSVFCQIVANPYVMPVEGENTATDNDYILAIEAVEELPETLILNGNDINLEIGIYIKSPKITTTLGFAVLPSDDRILMSLIEDVSFLSGKAFQNQENYYGGMSIGIKQSYDAEELLVAFGFLMPDGKIPLESNKENYLAHFNITIPKDLPTGTYTLEFDSYPSNTYANYIDSTTYLSYNPDLKPLTFKVKQAPKLTDVVTVCKMMTGNLPSEIAYDFDGDFCITATDFTIIKREFVKYSK